jgi:hypothetical protein
VPPPVMIRGALANRILPYRDRHLRIDVAFLIGAPGLQLLPVS